MRDAQHLPVARNLFHFFTDGIAGFAWVAPALMLACAWRKSGSESFRIGYVAGIFFWLATILIFSQI